MAEKYRTRVLEVEIIGRGPASWEWRLLAGREVLVCGFESTRVAASFAGYDAMFLALAAG
jgi:hypothetical protein